MSKGGTTSGSTEIPAWLENAAIENINKARDVSQIGYVPYYGPDVAAFSPMQKPLQAVYRAILVRLCMSSHWITCLLMRQPNIAP
mgnify:CR=1 FL=1